MLFVEAQGNLRRVATHGEEAWQGYLAERPDVLIADRDTPVLDGTSLTRRIRAQEADGYTDIVMLTGLDHAAEVRAGVRVGADDCPGSVALCDVDHVTRFTDTGVGVQADRPRRRCVLRRQGAGPEPGPVRPGRDRLG